jgi:competence/damage-inducible protein CinA-like protein
MNAEIIAIGSELILGETVDTNSSYLARQMAAAGIVLLRKSIVGDSEELIARQINEALGNAGLVICTGGLGPTADDLTREGVALALGRPLTFHQHLLDQIEARFRSFGRTMSPSNRRQAFVPEGARIIENPRGTAPAFIVEDARGTVIVLPGVPHEMRFLWETAVMPYLRNERGFTDVILVHTLHATGLAESMIGEIIHDLMVSENPIVGISAKRGQFELRISARAGSEIEAAALVSATEATIRERLGAYLIGGERLDLVVTRMLIERGLALALYEGSIRMPLFQSVCMTSDGRSLVRGIIVDPPEDGLFDPAMRAREGALAAQARWRTALAVGVQPAAQAGADGFTPVSVALVTPTGVHEWTRSYELTIDEGWEFIGTHVLDGLRQHFAGS